MKKKVIIIINYVLYLKNYINTGTFKEIEKKYNCYYLLDNSIKEVDIQTILKKSSYKPFKNKVLSFFEYSKLQKKIFTLLFNRVQLRNRNKFKNINYIVKDQLKLKLFYGYKNETFITAIKRFFLWSFKIFGRILNHIFIHEIFDEIMKKLIKTNKSLSNEFEKIKPDMVLIPFNGNNISMFDAMRYFNNKSQKKVFLLSENWDNLFSRYMINHPNHIGVWGEQTKKVLKLHNYRGRAYNLGAPRLEKYFKERNKKSKKLYKYNYAVFFDNASPRVLDNEIFLKEIDEYIDRNKKDFKNFKLIFRPHPYTFLQDIKLINFKKFKNIIIDPHMKDRYNYNLPTSNIRSSDTKYSIQLIKNAKFVVCSASSVTIEASIFHKNIIIYSPKKNSYDKKLSLIELWGHFKDITKLPNIKLCDDVNKIGPLFKKMNKSKINVNKNLIDRHRNEILFSNKKKYGERLVDTLDQILKK